MEDKMLMEEVLQENLAVIQQARGWPREFRPEVQRRSQSGGDVGEQGEVYLAQPCPALLASAV